MKSMKINYLMEDTIEHWKHIDIREPSNVQEYDELAKKLDDLLDIVGDNEDHQLIGLIDYISYVLSMYDTRENDEIKNVSGIEALKFLMDQHHLNQSQLPEVGSQGVVSEVLQGKRKLNINQIKQLSKKFQVSPNTFID